MGGGENEFFCILKLSDTYFFDMTELILLNPCLWLAVDVVFEQGRISGRDAPELWRAVIKDALLASRPEQAMHLLEPMRSRGLGTHVDCPGLVIECRDHENGARLFLKFLGSAYAFAPACLLALEVSLRSGVGRQSVRGAVQGFQVWHGNAWRDVPMPLRASDLQPWRACPAVLTGFMPQPDVAQQHGVLQVQSRSRWVWRKHGVLVSAPPDLSDVLHLIGQRVERFLLAWGDPQDVSWRASLAHAQEMAQGLRRVGHSWRVWHRKVGGKYPGHGHQGALHFEGALPDGLLFWLHVGSFLHVGQQTSIGLGGYALSLVALPASAE